jgi:hypothetical protein
MTISTSANEMNCLPKRGYSRLGRNHPLKDSRQLHPPVIVTMVAVRIMQMTIDQIVDMVAVRDRLVSAAGPMLVAAFELGGAIGRVGRVNRDYVLVDMIVMNVVQVAVVQIIDVVRMAYSGVAAIGAVSVGVALVLPFSACGHRWSPLMFI